MLSILGSAVLIWIVFATLDRLFRPRQKAHKKQFVIQDGNGLYWVVEEREQQAAPDDLPANVVQFPRGRA